MDLIEKLNWRYAVKAFIPEKRVPKEPLEKVLEALRLAPSSMGVQPYKVLVVENPKTRKALIAESYGQEKVATASHLLVFAIDTQLNDQQADRFLDLVAQEREVKREDLRGLEEMIKGSYQKMDQEMRINWAARQAYLALGVFLTACAHQGIDACPMEGFLPEKYDEILNLKEKGLKTVVIATIGFRSTNDHYQHFKKVRWPKDHLFEIIS